eukprot:CAMPEP_0206248538 /NCGR_PEP_ID=MMETSP0047_2-20121206/20425_1 /ASSEMBLY_ACC=CAM_ASM_000192 /TAXON_ID=195065 /ORGANISM="Chroomonas mesostigmatica_cf, Strain CCMP1168" /LENGTH=149 /DNA_ID=CAMNT_0053674193 /DNA_START=111 /DNA_END=560 /DNA_ORIENTATION=-
MAGKKWNENVELLATVMVATSSALILLSLAAYNKPELFGGKNKHVHALIPSALGVLIGLSSLGVRSEKARKAAAHIAVLAGVSGVFGAVPGLLKLPKLLSGGEVDKPDAARIQAVMFVLCLPFTAFSIAWFVANKKAQKAAAAAKAAKK